MMLSDADIEKVITAVETKKKFIKLISLLTGSDVEENSKVAFLGVFSANHIPEVGSGPSAFIVNTAVSKPGPFGEHWLFMFQETIRTLYFVDSFGRSPFHFNSYISDFVSKYGYYFNNARFQAEDTLVCGFYCLFFALITMEGRSVLDGLKELKNSENSDKYVVDYVNKTYLAAEMFMKMEFIFIIVFFAIYCFVVYMRGNFLLYNSKIHDLNYCMHNNCMMDIDGVI